MNTNGQEQHLKGAFTVRSGLPVVGLSALVCARCGALGQVEEIICRNRLDLPLCQSAGGCGGVVGQAGSHQPWTDMT